MFKESPNIKIKRQCHDYQHTVNDSRPSFPWCGVLLHAILKKSGVCIFCNVETQEFPIQVLSMRQSVWFSDGSSQGISSISLWRFTPGTNFNQEGDGVLSTAGVQMPRSSISNSWHSDWKNPSIAPEFFRSSQHLRRIFPSCLTPVSFFNRLYCGSTQLAPSAQSNTPRPAVKRCLYHSRSVQRSPMRRTIQSCFVSPGA